MEKIDFNNSLNNLSSDSDPSNTSTGNPATTPQPTSSDLPKPSILDPQTPQQQGSQQPILDPDKIWKIVREHIKLHVSPRDFNAWFSNVYLVKVENGIAEISCDQPYKREWIEKYHKMLIKKSILDATGQNVELSISIRSNFDNSAQESKPKQKRKYEYASPPLPNAQSQDTTDMPIFSEENSVEAQTKRAVEFARLNPKYTFGTFIVGENNRLAHAIAEAVSEKPGSSYNPVFFYGNTGVGKTHLMQAIGNAVIMKNPGKKIVYCSSEQFINELIEGTRTQSTDKFRNKYRNIDVLIIDDVQFIGNAPKTQDELFHTFNALYQSNKQIIMASDRPPRQIQNLTDRLKSRFEGGMVSDIQPPDYETRVAILKQKLIEFEASIPDQIIEFIAHNIESNIRELEGAVTKVATTMKFSDHPMTEEEVARILALDAQSKRKRIKPENILDTVCDVFGVTSREIKGKRRTAYVALSRQVVMYLLREILELPLEKIAREVNRTDHTTVLHACEKVEDLLDNDEKFKERVGKCKALISS